MFAKEARRERRKQHRYCLHPPIAFSVGDGPILQAYCRDISLGGAFLETDTPALFGSCIRLYLWVVGARGAERLSIESVVRWTSRDGFGVQFLAVGARETHALVELFHRGSGLAEVEAHPRTAVESGRRRSFFRASRARVQAYRRKLRALVERDARRLSDDPPRRRLAPIRSDRAALESTHPPARSRGAARGVSPSSWPPR